MIVTATIDDSIYSIINYATNNTHFDNSYLFIYLYLASYIKSCQKAIKINPLHYLI